MKTLQVDVAIVGFGTAGMNAYRSAKSLGKKVVSIESSHYGTTCARVGCMPSKLLISAAEALHQVRSAKQFGITVNGYQLDLPAVMNRIRAERDRFVNFVLKEVDSFPPEDKIWGDARFIDDNTIQVDENITIKTNAFVIATGSKSRVPSSFAGLGDKILSSDSIFELETLPEKVAVFGQGFIGLEIGQALHRLGVEMTLFASGSDSFAGISDPLIMEEARRILGSELRIELFPDVKAISLSNDKVSIKFLSSEKEDLEENFDNVFLATGRQPNIKDLGLENTSVEVDQRGYVIFDSLTLRCGESPIFVAGDVQGSLAMLHEAADEGTIAGLNAANYPNIQNIKRRTPLSIVFTDPNIAFVGDDFRRLESGSFVIGVTNFANQGRSRIMLKNKGLLHVYVHLYSRRFLGAQMIGPRVEHLAHSLSWLVQMGLTVDEILTMPFYHPVIEEGIRSAFVDAKKKLG